MLRETCSEPSCAPETMPSRTSTAAARRSAGESMSASKIRTGRFRWGRLLPGRTLQRAPERLGRVWRSPRVPTNRPQAARQATRPWPRLRYTTARRAYPDRRGRCWRHAGCGTGWRSSAPRSGCRPQQAALFVPGKQAVLHSAAQCVIGPWRITPKRRRSRAAIAGVSAGPAAQTAESRRSSICFKVSPPFGPGALENCPCDISMLLDCRGKVNYFVRGKGGSFVFARYLHAFPDRFAENSDENISMHVA